MSVVYPNFALGEADLDCREENLSRTCRWGAGAGTGPSGLEVNTDSFYSPGPLPKTFNSIF